MKYMNKPTTIEEELKSYTIVEIDSAAVDGTLKKECCSLN